MKTPRDHLLQTLKGIYSRARERSDAAAGMTLRGRADETHYMLEMVQQNREPPNGTVDRAVYNMAMNVLRVSGNERGITTLFNWMEADRVVPDSRTYGLALGLLGRKGMVDESLRIWKDMKRVSVKPDAPCYTEIMKGVARDGLINSRDRRQVRRRLLRTFAALVHAGYTPHPAHYSLLMRFADSESAALELFRWCSANNIPTDKWMVAGLLRFYAEWCRDGKADFPACFRLVMREAASAGLPLADTDASLALRAFVELGHHAAAEEAWTGTFQPASVSLTARSLIYLLQAAEHRIRATPSSAASIKEVALQRFEALRAQADLRWVPALWVWLAKVLLAAGDIEGAKGVCATALREGSGISDELSDLLRNLGMEKMASRDLQMGRMKRVSNPLDA